MNKSTLIGLLALLAFPAVGAAEDSASKLHFKVHGFSIAPLEEASDAPVQQVLIMLLPTSEGFSPNVNVQIQSYKGTIKEYAAMSVSQLKSLKLTLVSEKVTPTSATWEYSGEVQGRKLHFYSKAESSGQGKVYLVTATGSESGWGAVGPKLKACVDSFQRENGGKVAPADKPAK